MRLLNYCGWAALGIAAALLGHYAAIYLMTAGDSPVTDSRRPSLPSPPATSLVVVGPSEVVIDHDDRSKPLEYVFQLRNPTSHPIQVKKIWDGCVCLASRIEADRVEAGATVALTVRVKTFDAQRPEYREMVRVSTDSGDLDLVIRGSLPPPDSVRYRPTVIDLETTSDDTVVERFVTVRLPKQFRDKFASADIKLMGCNRIRAELTEGEPSESYREFAIRLSIPSDRIVGTSGQLIWATPGGQVNVRIQNARP